MVFQVYGISTAKYCTSHCYLIYLAAMVDLL